MAVAVDINALTDEEIYAAHMVYLERKRRRILREILAGPDKVLAAKTGMSDEELSEETIRQMDGDDDADPADVLFDVMMQHGVW